MKPAAKPEVLIVTDEVRVVAVPFEYDGGVDDQRMNRLDLWKDPNACREVRIEVATPKDALGARGWRAVDLDEHLRASTAREVILGILQYLANSGMFGPTAEDKGAAR